MKKIFGLFIVFLAVCTLFFSNTKVYAKDKTKPNISYSVDTTELTNGYVKLTVKITDNVGLKKLRYKGGYRTTSYFTKKNLGNDFKLTNNKRTFKISKNGTYTIFAEDTSGNTRIARIEINNIDKVSPTLNVSYKTLRQKATVSINAEDENGIKYVKCMEGYGYEADDPEWADAKIYNGVDSFETKDSVYYSFLAVDNAGNKTVQYLAVDIEWRAVWFTYIEWAPSYKYTATTEEDFRKYIHDAFENVKDKELNAVICQVRPYSDALYRSEYFPWSGFVSGEQGLDPGYDPMQIMIDEAHSLGLEFHAYLNPYRVNKKNSSNPDGFEYGMSENNPAVRWMNSSDPAENRNVLYFNSAYYYNPASAEVRELITNGVREIVHNYDVDGIHFDDYFYPTLGTKYETLFDADEYDEYYEELPDGADVLSISEWRRENVSELIRSVYSAIKEENPSCIFGISPAGNLNNLRGNDRYYCDIDKWCSQEGYIDYIAPQVYWGFEHPTCPFKETVNKWKKIVTSPSVKLYIGLAGHNAGTSVTSEWKSHSDILAREVKYTRSTNFVDGFIFYRYEFLTTSRSKKEIKNLLKLFD